MAVGIILSLSSTAIVMQTLAEKKLVHTEGGRASFAVLLFQDVAAIPLLAILPLLALGAAPAGGEEALEGAEALEHVSPWMRAALVVGAGAVVILAGRYLTRPVYHFLSWARLPEIQVAGALLMIVGVSLMMSALGLSPALGSFLAGVVLAELGVPPPARGRHRAVQGHPARALLHHRRRGHRPGAAGGGSAADPGLRGAALVLKMLVLWPLSVLFGLPARARLLFTLSLAQAGEFGFFLLGFATGSRVLVAGPDARRCSSSSRCR